MKYFVKTIALFSVLTFAGCQLVRDSDGFYTIESRKKDVSKQQRTQETKKTTTLDNNTISIKDTKRQEIETEDVDKTKYIDKPANGGMDDKEIIAKKMEEAIQSSNIETKQQNRFVADVKSNDVVKTDQKCHCQCDSNIVNKQDNVLDIQTIRKNEKTLYIQVGVFTNFETANALAETIKDNGINNVKIIHEDNMMKVVIGGFANKKSGQKIIDKLYEIGIDDYFWKNIK
ncbi:MAG: SPOR domain-containing protein [Rickettsiales bacterium]|nr:SPOR domain-containing protein [Rickettsiales bacterium]